MKTTTSMTAVLAILGSATAFNMAPVASSLRAAASSSALQRSSRASTTAPRGLRTLVAMADYKRTQKGEDKTEEYRVFYSDADGKDISPWHDIPLSADGGKTYNYVCEIPKYGTAKMEIATKEPLNPIAQDIKKGALRYYHGPIFWNYGYIPQTWEDPSVKHPELGVMGDGDPVDVVEIGSTKLGEGDCSKIKPLGCLAMIDDGELDWKVIAICESDPMAKELNDIADVEEKMPGTVSGIREWFRWYKTPDDKPLNEFGFDEKALDQKETVAVIKECNEHWENLMSGKTEKGKMWTGK